MRSAPRNDLWPWRGVHAILLEPRWARMGRRFRFAGLYALLTRELCQSVCSSATCLIPRPSRIYASICRASEPQPRLCCPPIGRPVDREASRLLTTRTARSPKKRSGGSTSSRSKAGRWPSAKHGPGKIGRPGLGLVVSAARVPAVHLQGFSSPRPGGFSPRPAEGGGVGGARSRNFGPDAPPKNKRKPNRKDSDRGPKGPIKERPVGRLYDADEDWRAKDEVEDVEVDNFATSAKKDDLSRTIRHEREEG